MYFFNHKELSRLYEQRKLHIVQYFIFDCIFLYQISGCNVPWKNDSERVLCNGNEVEKTEKTILERWL